MLFEQYKFVPTMYNCDDGWPYFDLEISVENDGNSELAGRLGCAGVGSVGSDSGTGLSWGSDTSSTI
jgi:hypothetical protein